MMVKLNHTNGEKINFSAVSETTNFNRMMPIFSHHFDDLRSIRLITSQLVVNGVASQAEIVRAFGVSKISVNRYVKCHCEEGSSGIFSPRRTRSATVFTAYVFREVQKSLDEGKKVSHICMELGIKTDTVNKAIPDGRLHREEKKPGVILKDLDFNSKSSRLKQDVEEVF